MIEKLSSLINRVFFFVAFLCLSLAIVDWFLRLFDQKLKFLSYQPGRLFEFGGIFLLFVIALLLRQIRENLKPKS